MSTRCYGDGTVIPLEVFTSQQAAVLTCWSPNSPPRPRCITFCPPHGSPCNQFTGTLISLLLRKPHPPHSLPLSLSPLLPSGLSPLLIQTDQRSKFRKALSFSIQMITLFQASMITEPCICVCVCVCKCLYENIPACVGVGGDA